MDNVTMARLLEQTADLMEIDGCDSFRIRSYRRAAEAVEQTTVDLVEACADTARLLAIPGIGKSMAANLQAIVATGSMPLRDELLGKYGSSILQLMKLPGMGPKTIALFWSAAQIASIDQLELHKDIRPVRRSARRVRAPWPAPRIGFRRFSREQPRPADD